jgi:hypothetical protein
MRIKISQFRRLTAAATAAIFLFSTVSAPVAEAGFWEDRRAARSARAGADEPLLLAQLPAVSSLSGVVSRSVPTPALASIDLSDDLKRSDLPGGLSRLPAAAGEVRGFHDAGAGAPFVVLVQDAHGIESAQKNVARILEHVQSSLSEEEHLLVGLEGATGAFRHEIYRAWPHASARRETAEFLLNRSLINGAEFHALTAERAPLLWGLEDKSLYLKNVEAYRKGAALSAGALSGSLGEALAEAKRRAYSPRLAEADALFDAYHQGRLDARGLLEGLEAVHGLSPRAGSDLALFAEALRAEKSLDFSAVEAERLEVVRALTESLDARELNALVARTLAFRLGELDAAAYYGGVRALLARTGADLDEVHPAFGAYIDYLETVQRIDAAALQGEIDELQDAAVRRFAVSPREAETARLARDWRLADKLARHELNSSEWKLYGERREAARRLPAALGVESAGWGEALAAAESFYETAEARNRALVASLAARRTGAVAAMIAGGFHTEGLRRELEDEGFSYAVVTPRLEVTAGGTDYLDFFAVDRTPVEKMLLGEKLLLAPTSALSAEPYAGFEHVGEVADGTFGKVYAALAATAADAETAGEIGAVTGVRVSARPVEGAGAASVLSLEDQGAGFVGVVSDISESAEHAAAVEKALGGGVRLEGRTSKHIVTIGRAPLSRAGRALSGAVNALFGPWVSKALRFAAIALGIVVVQAAISACEGYDELVDPNPPVEWAVPSAGQIAPVFVHQGHAYVVSGSYSHWALASGSDISVVDVNTRKVVGVYAPSIRPSRDMNNEGRIRHLAFADGKLVLTTGVGAFIVDIADPRKPVELGRVEAAAGESFQDVRVANGRAYVLVQHDAAAAPIAYSLRVYDVSSPSTPVFLGEKPMGTAADGAFGANGLQLLRDGKHLVYAAANGFEIWNVEEPTNIRAVAQRPGNSGHLTLAGNVLIVAGRDLEVWNVTYPRDPSRISSVPADGAIGRFGDGAQQGANFNYYDVASDGRLFAYQVLPGGQIARLGSLNFRPEGAGNWHVVGMDVAGDTAYVRTADYWSTGFTLYHLVRIDVSDPLQPRVIDTQMIFPMVDESAEGGRIGDGPVTIEPVVPGIDGNSTVRYEIPERGLVYVALYDAQGRQVRVLGRFEELGAGRHRVRWDGRNDAGDLVPAGAYEARIIFVGQGSGRPSLSSERLNVSSDGRAASVLRGAVNGTVRSAVVAAGLLASASEAWASSPEAALAAGTGLSPLVPVLTVLASLLLLKSVRSGLAGMVRRISAALARPKVSGTGRTGRDLSVPGNSSGGDGNGPGDDLLPVVQRGLLALIGRNPRARLAAERAGENAGFLSALAVHAGAQGDGEIAAEDVEALLTELRSAELKHAQAEEAARLAARYSALAAAAAETAKDALEQGADRLGYNASRLAAALGAWRNEFPETAGPLVLLAARDIEGLRRSVSGEETSREPARRAFMGQVSWGAAVPMFDGKLEKADIHAADLRRGMWERADYLEHVARAAAQGASEGSRTSWLLTDIDADALKAAFEAAARKSGSDAIRSLLARWNDTVSVVSESDLRSEGIVTPEGVVQLKKWILRETGAKDVAFGVAVTTSDAALWDVSGLREELVQILLWITSSIVFKAGPAQIEEYLKAQKVLDIQA